MTHTNGWNTRHWPTLRRIGGAALACALLGHAPAVVADDTEIFRSQFGGEEARPKVLIVFDDSGSMNTIAQQKPAYDPSFTYDQVGNIQAGRLYWAIGSTGSPPSATTSQWFNDTRNRCASSYTPLATAGYYIDRFGTWRTSGSYGWNTSMSTSYQDPLHVECRGDVNAYENDNGTGTGSPGDGYPRSFDPRPYGSSRQSSVDDNWETHRVYTANYMNWYHSTTLEDRSRLEVAQEVITGVINANPGIDFGLAVFNRNYPDPFSGSLPDSSDYDGGRIVRRIIEDSTAADRANIVEVVRSLRAEGSTPLCESMYEVYRYLFGLTVDYGAERHPTDVPGRDTAAEDPLGTYESPMSDCQYVYVILMTDGFPQADRDANARIEALTGKTCRNWVSDHNGELRKNCLPELTEYMYRYEENVEGDATNGEQRIVTYTIGFATDQPLLSEAAASGGGLYVTANDTASLEAAFQGFITEILATNATFTAPAVAVDSFTRTESRDEVFFAMFEPTNGTNWPGNIKKLRVSIANGAASLVDANGNEAIDQSTGHIADSARTFWSAYADGAHVGEGGVGELLAARSPNTRTIKTNTGTNGRLEDFSVANLTFDAFGLGSEPELYSLFGVTNAAQFADLVAWATGWTDASQSGQRDWVLGDILHSRPLVLNYGARGSATQADPDLRILVGTNAGFLHLFRNSTGAEDWAFFPKDLAPILSRRRANVAGGDTVYGVDSPPVVYRKDHNNDGTIDSTADPADKMYVFFGLRRGGKAYYALDVSDPDNPRFLWRIGKDSAGFGELGQSWSVPVVTNIPGYASNGVPKPVLIFAAGYDVANDDHATTAGSVPDTEGRGVFIVDAETGALVWSVTPADNSATNKQATELVSAMAAPVTTLDSNGDGLTDRVYVPDVGGNVWRIDLAGFQRPQSATDQGLWRLTRLAGLSGITHADDRRFFNAVDVARTRFGNLSFDAVMLGSGDRTNPNSVDNNDRFYVLRDMKTSPYLTDAPTDTECGAGSYDPRCNLPITNADLYDASENLIQDGTDAQKEAAAAALASASGWYLNLAASDGEKSLARSLSIAGKVYFTTFAPDITERREDICKAPPGFGRLYVVSLATAQAVTDFTRDRALSDDDRIVDLGGLIPDSPSVHFGSDREIRLLFPSGGGVRGFPNPLDTGARLRQPYGTFWYEQEF